ncbi:MAG: putative ABC transport system ATP-binding protein [Cellvibrionaceae bacterium]
MAEEPILTVAIKVENLERVYGSGEQKVIALKQLSLEVPAGQFMAIKGRSGSGKTTLLNCLGGLDKPTSGSIQIFGSELTRLNDDQLTRWRREKVGFVFQSFGLLPTLSAYENVELMLRINGVPFRQRRERIDECLGLVGLNKWATHRPYELSGGQQQRLAIARAIVTRPQLILADEPTGELDTETAMIILELFRNIVETEKMTIFASSHDSLVDEYVDEVLQLHDGAILTI